MMLALERSLGVVADLALFADHADRKRVYYIPTRPRIAKVDGRQELSFVRFRRADAAEGGIGLLSFTAELTPMQAQLDKPELARAFPDRQIVPVPCRPLIWQNGSLHCLTMQLPKGLL